MKKGSFITLSVFSGLAIFAMIFFVVSITNHGYLVDVDGYDNSTRVYSLVDPFVILGAIFAVVSAIGTFVCSIISLTKIKKFSEGKGLVISVGVVGIILSVILFGFGIVSTFVNPLFGFSASIVMFIIFALSAGICVKATDLSKQQATA